MLPGSHRKSWHRGQGSRQKGSAPSSVESGSVLTPTPYARSPTPWGSRGGEREAFVAAAPRRVGMAYDAPAIASRERATLLPTPPTPLVGRDREVAAVTFTLERSETRLLTLTGPGGVGKTRLALEVAAGAAESFPDGVALVELAPIMDPDLLPSTIARALGLRETGGWPAHELLLGHIEDRRMLIVLDNFEHLLGAAPEVAGLLSACPRVKVLATSRAPLRVRGE